MLVKSSRGSTSRRSENKCGMLNVEWGVELGGESHTTAPHSAFHIPHFFSYHRQAMVPQARPAPKPDMIKWSPRRMPPARTVSSRAIGMLAAEVLP